jgi:hypothetical protein
MPLASFDAGPCDKVARSGLYATAGRSRPASAGAVLRLRPDSIA